MSGTDKGCGHYGDHVAVTIVDLRDQDVGCSWCGEAANTGLLKSQRHKLALCEDCDGVLNGMYHGDMRDKEDPVS